MLADELGFGESLETAAEPEEPKKEATESSWRAFKPRRRSIPTARKRRRRANPRPQLP
jgi:hypothetical protein